VTSLILLLLAACNSGANNDGVTDDTGLFCGSAGWTATTPAWDDDALGLSGTQLLDQLDALGLASVRDVHWVDAVGGQPTAPASLECDRQAATLRRIDHDAEHTECPSELEVTIPCTLNVADGGVTSTLQLRLNSRANLARMEASDAPLTLSSDFAASSGWPDADIVTHVFNVPVGGTLTLPLIIGFIPSDGGAAYGAFSFE